MLVFLLIIIKVSKITLTFRFPMYKVKGHVLYLNVKCESRCHAAFLLLRNLNLNVKRQSDLRRTIKPEFYGGLFRTCYRNMYFLLSHAKENVILSSQVKNNKNQSCCLFFTSEQISVLFSQAKENVFRFPK